MVHARVLAGVGAWLLGAGAATAGSLLAVSLLGQGIADNPGQQLTTAAVNRALARESQEAGPAGRAGSPPASSPAPAPRPTRSATSRATSPRVSRPAARPPATSSDGPPATLPSAGTVLTSPGGTVLAECRPAGTYLVSWSPVQGYEAGRVTRGPAARARVVFQSDANTVTMTVTCPAGPAGAPIAASYADGWGDGGGGGDD